MADDLLHPDDRPDPTVRFRADLAGYLRGLSGPELADLLDGLPDPVKVDLIAALAARGRVYARLPDTWPGHPDAEFMRRRSLREVVADRRAARAARRAGPPPGATLADWATNRSSATRPNITNLSNPHYAEALAALPVKGERARPSPTRQARTLPRPWASPEAAT
jgi:hypothetical protein